MSTRSKAKRDKQRKIRGKTHHPKGGSKPFDLNTLSLTEVWRAQKHLSGLPASGRTQQQLQTVGHLFAHQIQTQAAQGQLMEALDHPDMTGVERMMFVGDVLDEVADVAYGARTGGAVRVAVWAVPILGAAAQLLAVSRGVDGVANWAQSSGLLPAGTRVVGLGVVGVNVAMSLAPQSLWNLRESVRAVWAGDGSVHADQLASIRQAMAPFSVAQVLGERLMGGGMQQDLVGSGVVVLGLCIPAQNALLDTVMLDGSKWAASVAAWRTEQGMPHIIVGTPEVWTQAVARAAQMQVEFFWGAQAKDAGRTDSVLNVDRVVVSQQMGHTRYDAYVNGVAWAQAKLPMTATLWCQERMLDSWTERDVLVAGGLTLEQIKTMNLTPSTLPLGVEVVDASPATDV